MQLVIVSGLSGAGKTVALKQLEDLGYYCIDNIPLLLLEPLAERAVKFSESRYQRMAVGIDAREGAEQIADFSNCVTELRASGVKVHVIFLTARTDIILRRYNETRRPHPLTDAKLSLADAVERERELLEPISSAADEVIDTSAQNLHELREEIARRMPESGKGRLAVTFMSFGFKNGAPAIADFIFDVRCLPNPHWEPKLRPQTGQDPAVIEFLSEHQDVRQMLQDIQSFLERWLPKFEHQDRAYVTVAIGCTGGHHRSVYITELLARHFEGRFESITKTHRELLK